MSLPPPKQTARHSSARPGQGASGFVFQPATKTGAKARVAVQGVSGSGKTWTSLSIAHGLAEGQRFAVIDTERGAASLYAGINGIQFDVLQMHRYDPRDLGKALDAAAEAGYDVVCVDSWSHFWKGTDGTLDQVERAKSRYSNNSFAGWKEGTPMQNDMVDALLAYPGHIVVTMRSQTEWVLQENEKTGKREPVRMGMRAEQRKGVEYEFGLVCEMDIHNTLRVLKSRCPALHRAVIHEPNGVRDIAQPLLKWLNDDGQAPAPAAAVRPEGGESAVADPVVAFADRALGLDTYEAAVALHAEVEAAGLLDAPHLDGEQPTTLGAYIRARGTALKTN